MPNRAHETTRLGLFTVQACLPRTSLVRGFADAVRHSLEEVRVAFPSSGDWQMRLFIGRARLCPSCGHLPSFADS